MARWRRSAALTRFRSKITASSTWRASTPSTRRPITKSSSRWIWKKPVRWAKNWFGWHNAKTENSPRKPFKVSGGCFIEDLFDLGQMRVRRAGQQQTGIPSGLLSLPQGWLPVGLYAYPKTAFCPAIRRRRSDGTTIVDYRQGRRESVFQKPDNGAILLLDNAVFV